MGKWSPDASLLGDPWRSFTVASPFLHGLSNRASGGHPKVSRSLEILAISHIASSTTNLYPMAAHCGVYKSRVYTASFCFRDWVVGVPQMSLLGLGYSIWGCGMLTIQWRQTDFRMMMLRPLILFEGYAESYSSYLSFVCVRNSHACWAGNSTVLVT